MILILKNKLTLRLSLLFLALFLPVASQAQSFLALSVTPTLFDMSAERGQVWQSSVKVVNSNSFPIDIYANVVNFTPQGEAGRGKFMPVFEEFSEGATLAEWIDLAYDKVTIAPEASKEIPFVVTVPKDAAPGSHFAAVMIGTQPPDGSGEKMQVRTSQIVTSLFFLRIEGDVVEKGTIRSFTVDDSYVEEPVANFELRFENKGNVHLQPQGSIEIYNMWGKERGTIPINHKTHFGNVLPDSIRKFSFSWSGEPSLTDIGLYKAVVSLAYGESGRKFTSRTTHFWVIPLKAGALTLLSVILIILFIRWSIKAYVRRMLVMAGVQPGREGRSSVRRESADDVLVTSYNYKTVGAPLHKGWLDFKMTLLKFERTRDYISSLGLFIKRYKTFFGAMLILILIIILISWYFVNVSKDRSYEIAINNPGERVEINSEQMVLDDLIKDSDTVSGQAEDQDFQLKLINTSGQPGVAAKVAAGLISKGYRVDSVETDSNRYDKKTVIVYDLSLGEDILDLSEALGNVLPSVSPITSTPAIVTIFVGKDQISK